uniref:Uncharacterized protein n=1 Tax=Romanomermis culicivorax TaxID=13658 RepID=A0A915LC49_ROMCU
MQISDFIDAFKKLIEELNYAGFVAIVNILRYDFLLYNTSNTVGNLREKLTELNLNNSCVKIYAIKLRESIGEKVEQILSLNLLLDGRLLPSEIYFHEASESELRKCESTETDYQFQVTMNGSLDDPTLFLRRYIVIDRSRVLAALHPIPKALLVPRLLDRAIDHGLLLAPSVVEINQSSSISCSFSSTDDNFLALCRMTTEPLSDADAAIQ